jgi:hypothetical protein
MANKDLFKQAIAEAKSVREAAIANAKEALEESLTPHLKDMLAAKLQEMEDKDVDEVAVTESDDEDVNEAPAKDDKDEAVEEEFTAVEEAEDEEDELEADGEGEEAPEEAEDELEEPAEDEDLKDLSVEDFKDLIRDIISQEMGAGEAEMEPEMGADDMDAGAIEEPGEGDPLAGEEGEEEIDLDELIRELEAVSEGESEDDMEEGKKDDKEMDEAKDDKEVDEVKDGPTKNEIDAESDSKESNVNDTIKEDLTEALSTIETLRSELNEVNLLNSKLLYVNKIFKANNLSESQKVNIIAAFDKAETVKEVKLVFETVSENVVTKKETTSIKEHKGSASKATGITASKPGVIGNVSESVLRMQKLAGIIK